MPDKYTALWLSHSSIRDYLICPRAYYLKNVYKDPKTNHKIQIISPPLSLGQAVHQVVESLSVLPTNKRFQQPLMEKFHQAWQKVSGIKGGFFDLITENKYKDRGQKMIQRVIDHPGPLNNLAVKIDDDLPSFYLSEVDNIILCGKIDWLEYLPDTNSVHIIDFKTSTKEEDPKSLQLPIYHLLVKNCQKRKVTKVSYWYLQKDNKPTKRTLPNLKLSRQIILKIAKKIKLARQLNNFKCSQKDGCYACRNFDAILQGKGKFVGTGGYGRDIYVLKKSASPNSKSSTLL